MFMHIYMHSAQRVTKESRRNVGYIYFCLTLNEFHLTLIITLFFYQKNSTFPSKYNIIFTMLKTHDLYVQLYEKRWGEDENTQFEK